MGNKVYLVGLALLITLIPGCTLPKPPEEGFNNTEKNTLIFSLLSKVGIPETVVDVTGERVLVRYELPADMGIVSSWFAIMGAASATAPEVPLIIIQTYTDYSFSQELKVDTEDALALMNNELTIEEFCTKYGITVS